MPKRVLAIFLLVAMVSSNFTRFFVYAGFQLNQKLISATLCENKNKPWLNCEGRCYLMKKLQDTEEKEKKQEQEQKRAQFQEALFENVAVVTCMVHEVSKPIYPKALIPGLAKGTYSVFLPPKIA